MALESARDFCASELYSYVANSGRARAERDFFLIFKKVLKVIFLISAITDYID